MITVTFQRAKCIGCNYCVESAPDRWRISKKDGKANLVGAKAKKGFYSIKLHEFERSNNLKAMKRCPVKIIEIQKCM